jgi:hypothetical protein
MPEKYQEKLNGFPQLIEKPRISGHFGRGRFSLNP